MITWKIVKGGLNSLGLMKWLTFLVTNLVNLMLFIVLEFVTDLLNLFFTKGLTASVCKSDKMD